MAGPFQPPPRPATWRLRASTLQPRPLTGPTPAEYPEHRRRANGKHAFDLFERVYHAEIPEPLAVGPAWRHLGDAANDLSAWCNDLASLERERACGDTTNYVTVYQKAHAATTQQSIAWVQNHITERLHHLDTAYRQFGTDITTHSGLSPAAKQRLAQLAAAVTRIPGAHRGWLTESGRYSAVPGD